MMKPKSNETDDIPCQVQRLVIWLFIFLMLLPSMVVAKDTTFHCDELCKAIVTDLKSRWGVNAEVYWNGRNFVVISKDGYISEFR